MADNEAPLRVGDRVEAADDTLRGVPAGTPGKVIGVSGLTWIRYRVSFDNGREHNLVDAKRLRRRSPLPSGQR
ncbi:MAG TPA: hypothetical protein VM390_12840 [Acidimicrobiales bacterium]|jgi:hypothetical protein|nr:hypothetical protein [Acidimicrobiales bacterium]